MKLQNATLENKVTLGNSIAFIDSSVSDCQTLAAGVTPGTEVFILDGTRDGIAQISEILQTSQNIAALHIISHGSPGSVQLGNTWLNLGNIETYATQLIQWRSALTDNTDILIYGCNIAADIDPNTQAGLFRSRKNENEVGVVPPPLNQTATTLPKQTKHLPST